jgi:hypothetical protein
LKTKSGVAELTTDDGRVASTNAEKANALNEFFASVFTEENGERPKMSDRLNVDQMTEIEVSEEEVMKQLESLNPNKSPGPDGIHPKVLKEARAELVRPLTKIFKLSLKEGKIPKQWKEGEITPIFKKGDRTKPGNYRPVSLTSVLCKMLEGIVRKALLKQLQKHLSPHQHGFVEGRSCATQLLDTLDNWTRILDTAGTSIDAIYLDFAKAFDSVPHRKLLDKLECYRIKDMPLKWLTDFLSNRKQRVSVSGEKSEWRNVISGIPQGSVLGPVLFVYFINDMPEAVQGYLRMFADDTKIFSQVNSDDEHKKLQEDLDALHSWSETWQLKFNAGKCAVMHLGFKNQERKYTMGQIGNKTQLKKTTCEKDLGVFVDPTLKFSIHCQKSASKANRILGMIRRSFDHLDGEMLTQLYKGLIRPHLEYGNAVWCPQFKKDAVLLENVQRRATRMIPKVRDLGYEERLRALKLPSLTYRRLRGDLIEAFKYNTERYKVKDNIFKTKKGGEGEEAKKGPVTRGHEAKLEKQGSRLENRRHFLSNRVLDYWNELPESLIRAKSVDAFKNGIDRHFSNIKFQTTLSPKPGRPTDYY